MPSQAWKVDGTLPRFSSQNSLSEMTCLGIALSKHANRMEKVSPFAFLANQPFPLCWGEWLLALRAFLHVTGQSFAAVPGAFFC